MPIRIKIERLFILIDLNAHLYHPNIINPLYFTIQTSYSINKMTQRNPSLFVRLPKLNGAKWHEADIIEVIDNLDYGVVEDVSINANKFGEQYAVVHFDRWFRGAEEVVTDLLRGERFNVPGLYGKSVSMNLYSPSSQQSRSYVRDRRMNRYTREHAMVASRVQESLSIQESWPIQESLSIQESWPIVNNAVYVQTIAGKLPIAPGLTFGHPVHLIRTSNNRMEALANIEDGEIVDSRLSTHRRPPVSRR